MELASFCEILPELLKEHRDEFVLLTLGTKPEFYKTWMEASKESIKKYGLEKVVLIQEITDIEETNFVANAIV